MSVYERITKEIHSGMVLYTPVKRARFTIHSVEPDRLVFSVGSGSPIPVPRTCWDKIPYFLRGQDWVKIGQKHDVAEKGTLEAFLDTQQNPHQHRHPSWASYVVPVLEHLKIVEVYHRMPSRVKLNPNQ